MCYRIPTTDKTTEEKIMLIKDEKQDKQRTSLYINVCLIEQVKEIAERNNVTFNTAMCHVIKLGLKDDKQ